MHKSMIHTDYAVPQEAGKAQADAATLRLSVKDGKYRARYFSPLNIEAGIRPRSSALCQPDPLHPLLKDLLQRQ